MRSLMPNFSRRRIRTRKAQSAKPYLYNILGLGFWIAVILFFWSIIYLASRM
jgi:hypothetical protein